MKEKARKICQEGKGYWPIYKGLVRLGIPPHRTRRMARYATQGLFLWEGIKTPLREEEYRRGEIKLEVDKDEEG